jgi:hypothetical protein
MPIKVQCACGKAFAAKDELAGKTVKCPGCQQPLKIPGGSAAPADGKPAAKAAAAKSATAAKQPAAKQPATRPATPAKPAAASTPAALGGGSSSLFDEVGLQAPTAGTVPCPGCKAPLPPQAVLCVQCGYNLKLGRKMQTVVASGGGHLGHGAVAADLMERAAAVIDDDAEEEIKKTTSGMPWWGYFLILLALIGLAAFMLLYWSKEEPKDDKKHGQHPGGATGSLVLVLDRAAAASPLAARV